MRSPSSAQISEHCVNQANVGVPTQAMVGGRRMHRGMGILTFGCMVRDQFPRFADKQHGAHSGHEGANLKENRTRNLG